MNYRQRRSLGQLARHCEWLRRKAEAIDESGGVSVNVRRELAGMDYAFDALLNLWYPDEVSQSWDDELRKGACQ